jgi:hypothetical protein
MWSSVPLSVIQPLMKKQRAAVRILAGAYYNAHTKPLFENFEILPLTDLTTCFNLKFFHSFVYNYAL